MNFKNDKKEKYTLLDIKLGLVFLMGLFLTACVSSPLKAPCDQYATFCGTKTPINHWA